MATIGFLHTEPEHVQVFARLVAERAPWLVDIHLVDETLLADIRRGLDDDVRARLGARLGELIGRAVDAVVCTCAVLGDEAVRVTERAGVPVFSPEQLASPMSRDVLAALR